MTVFCHNISAAAPKCSTVSWVSLENQAMSLPSFEIIESPVILHGGEMRNKNHGTAFPTRWCETDLQYHFPCVVLPASGSCTTEVMSRFRSWSFTGAVTLPWKEQGAWIWNTRLCDLDQVTGSLQLCLCDPRAAARHWNIWNRQRRGMKDRGSSLAPDRFRLTSTFYFSPFCHPNVLLLINDQSFLRKNIIFKVNITLSI